MKCGCLRFTSKDGVERWVSALGAWAKGQAVLAAALLSSGVGSGPGA